MNQKYSVVLFDMDGTLTDTMRLQPLLIKKYLLSNPKNMSFKEIQSRMASIYYQNQFTWFKLKTPIYFSKVFQKSIFRMFRLSPIMAFQYWRALRKERTFASAAQIITHLKNVGIKVGLVTNGTNFEVNIKVPSIRPLFDFQITATDVSKKKPNPEMILKGMKKAHSVPGKTLYVGDTLVDMLAATNAGCDFALMTTGTFGAEVVKIGQKKPKNIFPSLEKLEEFILKP